MSQITRGRLAASHGIKAGCGLCAHDGATRLDVVCWREDEGRDFVGDAFDSRLTRDGFGITGGAACVEEDVVASEERVVRFVGDSVGGGGKSLGWFLVATMIESVCYSVGNRWVVSRSWFAASSLYRSRMM